MHTSMKAALESGLVLLVYLVKMELPDEVVCLVDGAGFVVWGGDTYRGSHPVFGALNGFGDFLEHEGNEAPRQVVNLLPHDPNAIVALSAPGVQGSPVTISAAVIDRQTGLVVGAPDVRFAGVLDDAVDRSGVGERALELELCTAWDRLFDDNEGHRWNNSFWTHLYGSNARAFEHIPNVAEPTYWGFKGPANTGGASVGGGSGGGGGGSIGGSEYAQVFRQ